MDEDAKHNVENLFVFKEGTGTSLSTRFERLMESTKLMRWLWARIKEAGFTFMNLSVQWSGSLLLLPLPSGKTLAFCRKGNASSPLLCGC